MKAVSDKSRFFVTRVKFLGHIVERNTLTPLKSRVDAVQKLQSKIQELLGTLNFLYKIRI